MQKLRALRPHLPLILVLVATSLVGIPTFFEPPWYDDEGIYAAVAHALLEGETIYRDTLDNRPPGLYFIYAAILSIAGPSPWAVKLGADIAVLAEQIILYLIGRKLWSPGAGLLAAAVTGLFYNIPTLEGNIANAEVFMAAPAALGMLLALNQRWMAAGFALSAAFLIKQIAGLEFAAVAGAMFLWTERPRLPLLRLSIGFAIPVLAVGAYLAQQGALNEFISAGFLYYVGYVQRGTRIPASPEFMVVRTLICLGAAVVVWQYFWGKPRSQELFSRGLIWFWLVAAAYGMFFTARPYPHYILQVIPALTLAISPYLTVWRTVPIEGWSGGRILATFTTVGACVWLFVVIYMPWPSWATPSRTAAYYVNFAGYVSGRSTPQQYNDFFDRRVNRNLNIVSYLRRHSAPGSYVLVWGDEPWLYPLADVVNPSRYNVSYFAYEVPNGLDEVANAVRVRKPRFVVWTKNKPLYPKLKEELDANYRVVTVVENADILERIEPERQQDRVQTIAVAQPDR